MLIGALCAAVPALYVVVLALSLSDSTNRAPWDLDAGDIVGLVETVGLIVGAGALVGRFVGRRASPLRASPTIRLIVGGGALLRRIGTRLVDALSSDV